jgi:5'-deoxynucleotidase YfbR-like HD superfamily hydrolase
MTEEKNWIQTYTGLKFHVDNPTVDEISIRDIAHQLSFSCRYTGATSIFYSVGEHSLLVDSILVNLGIIDPKVRLEGLLHDAAEAYLPDVPSPIKHLLLPDFVKLEKKYLKVIGKKFKVQLEPKPAIVDKADKIALAMEYRDLRTKIYDWGLTEKPLDFYKIVPKSFITNEIRFMKLFKELNEQLQNNNNGKT